MSFCSCSKREGYENKAVGTTAVVTLLLLKYYYCCYSLIFCSSMAMVTSFRVTPSLFLWRQIRYVPYNHYNSKMKNCRLIQHQSKSHVDTSTDSNTSLKQADTVIPRAAVSVLVRHSQPNEEKDEDWIWYALVQRGKEPNKGMWSLPGGKIETGEVTLQAAKRELWEETGLSQDSLDWCQSGPITCSDSIILDPNNNDTVLFHYVISQCFAQTKTTSTSTLLPPPTLNAADDAADAKWWKLKDIQKGINDGIVTPGVERVIIRAEHMHQAGLLLLHNPNNTKTLKQ